MRLRVWATLALLKITESTAESVDFYNWRTAVMEIQQLGGVRILTKFAL